MTEGVVRLSIADDIGIIFLVPKLARLAEIYPHIRLELVATQSYFHLLENRVDLMVSFAEERQEDLTSIRMGTLHLIPFASRQYIEKHGVPTRENVADHVFVDSKQYSAKTELWARWRDVVGRGRTVYTSDSATNYAVLVRAGLGIGLLPSVNALDASAVVLDLGCHVKLPLYLTVLLERLQSKPVRIVRDFIASVLGEQNPYLADEVDVNAPPSHYMADYQTISKGLEHIGTIRELGYILREPLTTPIAITVGEAESGGVRHRTRP